jgi:hypothetical protein
VLTQALGPESRSAWAMEMLLRYWKADDGDNGDDAVSVS